jgi:hypothetical protein
MDNITVDRFRELVPKFSDPTKYPDEDIQTAIDLAVLNFNSCVWGDKLQAGQALWVAHWLMFYGTSTIPAMTRPSFATSKKVGDTAITYSDAVAGEMLKNPYMWTPYGQQYWFMLQTLPTTGLMIV